LAEEIKRDPMEAEAYIKQKTAKGLGNVQKTDGRKIEKGSENF